MSKLEYDSFPKFIVSIGIALWTLPVLAVYFFLQESSILLISEEELSHLTETARQTVALKQGLAYALAHNGLLIGVSACFVLGFILVIWGGVMWRSRQKVLDENDKVELETKKLKLQKATPEEKEEKITQEVLEAEQIVQGPNDQPDKGLSVAEIREKQAAARKENAIRQLSTRYRQVEDAAVSEIRNHLHATHDTQANVKVRNLVLDAVAVSSGRYPDYIFEITYLSSASSWNSSRWHAHAYQMQRRLEAYYEETGRTAVPVLIIVTLDDLRDKVERMVKEKLQNIDFVVKVVSEKEIGIENK